MSTEKHSRRRAPQKIEISKFNKALLRLESTTINKKIDTDDNQELFGLGKSTTDIVSSRCLAQVRGKAVVSFDKIWALEFEWRYTLRDYDYLLRPFFKRDERNYTTNFLIIADSSYISKEREVECFRAKLEQFRRDWQFKLEDEISTYLLRNKRKCS